MDTVDYATGEPLFQISTKNSISSNMGKELHSAVTNYNFKITNVPVLTAISVVPSSATLPLNISAQFQAIGNYFCGSEQDITGTVSWSVGDNSIAAVEDVVGHSTGILQTINEGRTVFNATLDNLQGSSNVYVVPVHLLDIDQPAQSGRFVRSPVVSINETGNSLVSYLDTGKVIVVGHDVQDGWLQKEEISDRAYGGYGLKIDINNSGGRLAAWRLSHDVYVSIAPPGMNFGPTVSIAQPYSDHGYVYAGMDSDGDGLIVWTDWSNAIMSYTIYSSRYDHVTGIWSTPEYLGTRGWSDGQLHLAVSNNGSAILLWNASNVDRDGAWKLFASNFSKSTGWQQPLELYTSNVYGTESVDINDRGDAIVVWSEWRLNPDSNSRSLHAAFYSQSEGWQPQQRINTGSDSLPQSPMVKMNQNNEAIVLWYNTEYSGVYTIHINTYHPLSGWSDSELIRPLGMVGAPTLYTPFIDNDGNKLVLWHPESLINEGCIEMRRSTSSGGWGNIEGLDMVEIMACTSPSLISVASNSQGKGIIAWQLPMLFLSSQGMLESVIYNFASAKFGL